MVSLYIFCQIVSLAQCFPKSKVDGLRDQTGGLQMSPVSVTISCFTNGYILCFQSDRVIKLAELLWKSPRKKLCCKFLMSRRKKKNIFAFFVRNWIWKYICDRKLINQKMWKSTLIVFNRPWQLTYPPSFVRLLFWLCGYCWFIG